MWGQIKQELPPSENKEVNLHQAAFFLSKQQNIRT